MLSGYPKLPSRASGKGPLPERSGSISSDTRVDFELITSFYPARIKSYFGGPGARVAKLRESGTKVA